MKSVFRSSLLWAACVVGLGVLPAMPMTQTNAWAAPTDNQLILRAGRFDPASESLKTSAKLAAPSGWTRFGIVQFNSAQATDAAVIDAAGATVLEYIPNNAFLVRWDAESRQTLESHKAVRFVGNWNPAYKVSPTLWRETRKTSAPVDLEIMGFRGQSVAALTSVVQKMVPGASVKISDNVAGLPLARVVVPAGESLLNVANKLAVTDQVMWLDRHYPVRIHNSDSVGVIQANGPSGGPPPDNAPLWDQDILGTGQIVAVADSGLDRNAVSFSQWHDGTALNTTITDAEFLQADEVGQLFMDRKVVGYFVQPGAFPYDHNEDCGGTTAGYHGTHVTGTVAGDGGDPSTPTEPNHDGGDGMAPNAQLLFQQLGNAQEGCLAGRGGFPMFIQAADAGAGVSNGSYGSDAPEPPDNGYFGNDFEADAAAYAREDILLVFSAGNEGPGPNTAGHPAQAKSPVSVGATEHGDDRTPADFSSRGPAHDGRIKPDVMAPGVRIRSVLGNSNNDNPAPVFNNNPTSGRQGTSMSSPTVAGGAVLMRQYFMDGFYPTGVRSTADAMVPSGALMKSAIINGASTYAESPSMETGWGRMFLDNNLYFAGDTRQLRVWDRPNGAGLNQGDTESFAVQVEAGEEFRATLAWTDPPATSVSGTALINNLDLVVSNGDQTWLGNVINGAESTTGGNADAINTVEQVRLTAPQAGEYTVSVRGSAIPGNGVQNTNIQGFALAVSAAQCETGVAQAGDFSVTANDQTVDLDINSLEGAEGFQVYRALGSCASPDSPFKYVGQSADGNFADARTQGGFEYAYQFRGVDGCGEGPVSACKSVVSEAACTLLPDFDATKARINVVGGDQCGIDIDWDVGKASCPGVGLKYNVYRSVDPFFVPAPENRIASITASGYQDLDVEPLTTYYYAIRAEDGADSGSGPDGGNETGEVARIRATTRSDVNVPGTYVDDIDVQTFVSTDAPWQVSQRRSSTGTFSFHNANDGETHPNLTCAYLTTPPIELESGSPRLTYDAWYNLEEFWDGVVVEISTDGGANWQDLPPAGGYPSDFSMTAPDGEPINECGYAATQGAFNGVRESFQEYASALDAYAGQTVQIRWAFSSDPGLEFEGFYLDNVAISNASTPAACIAGALSRKISGPWFNENQSGHGWLIELLQGPAGEPDLVNAYWYVYQDSKPVWLIGTGPVDGTRADLNMFITDGADFLPNFEPDAVNLTPWGTLSFDFDSDTTGTASWDSSVAGFGSGSLPMSQLAQISTSGNACRSGSYFNADQNGHGIVMEVVSVGGQDQVILAWYVYQNGEQVWLFGQAPLNGDTVSVPLSAFNGADFPPNFDAGAVNISDWGTLDVTFNGPDDATMSWQPTASGYTSGTLDVTRLTGLKGGGTCQ
ncbi:MAG: S8 family serine peptidase [Lysobacterales bacterium]